MVDSPIVRALKALAKFHKREIDAHRELVRKLMAAIAAEEQREGDTTHGKN